MEIGAALVGFLGRCLRPVEGARDDVPRNEEQKTLGYFFMPEGTELSPK